VTCQTKKTHFWTKEGYFSSSQYQKQREYIAKLNYDDVGYERKQRFLSGMRKGFRIACLNSVWLHRSNNHHPFHYSEFPYSG